MQEEERAPAPPAVPEKRAPAPRRFRISTPRAAAWGVAALVLLGVSIYGFYRAERFLMRNPRFQLGGGTGSPALEVFGTRHAASASIESVFQEDMNRSVYLVPIEERLMSLRTVDWVEEASVARIWPNRLLVHVVERQPIAFLRLPSDRVAMIDRYGVILPRTRDRFDLPVLAGVSPRHTLAQRRAAAGRLLDFLAQLGEAAGELSEIDVADPDNLAVSRSYQGRAVKLILGGGNYAVRYGNFLNHFDEIATRLPGATILDMRDESRITVLE
jgi:cell division protein FtsQ